MSVCVLITLDMLTTRLLSRVRVVPRPPGDACSLLTTKQTGSLGST
jgi:hypothetical protein